jgi:hypothetical protein
MHGWEKYLIGGTGGKRPSRRPTRMCEDNFEKDLKLI